VATSLTSSVKSDDGSIILSGLSGAIIRSDSGGENFLKIKQSGFEAYNAVDALPNSALVLVSDKGVHFQSY